MLTYLVFTTPHNFGTIILIFEKLDHKAHRKRNQNLKLLAVTSESVIVTTVLIVVTTNRKVFFLNLVVIC